jgi:HSP20 family molecular chaperone IbpA
MFLVEMPMPEVGKKDIEVTVKGRRLFVTAKPLGCKVPVKMTIEVPVGYSPDEALVFYFQDRLQIAIRRNTAA